MKGQRQWRLMPRKNNLNALFWLLVLRFTLEFGKVVSSLTIRSIGSPHLTPAQCSDFEVTIALKK